MGIPKFFRFVCENYPCTQEEITQKQIVDYDYFYLDLNGVIHACSHPEDSIKLNDISDSQIFDSVVQYVDTLFNLIKPKKLLYLAVDGIAPRAKFHQQRGRRFRAAIDSNKYYVAILHGIRYEHQRFDPSSITPGTQFMISLQKYLKYYVSSRVTTNAQWQKCEVILAGPEVPGEGEHKIIEYIRYMRTLPDYDPYARHCIYGLDEDLVALGLCTHELNFSILRDELTCGRRMHNIPRPEDIRYVLTHLSVLREYLDHEFQGLRPSLTFNYNADRIADDWVLLSFLLGNDFVPNLPDFHVTKGGFTVLCNAYLEVLPTLDGYLNENGNLNLARFNVFMRQLGRYEKQHFIRNAKLLETERPEEYYEDDDDENDLDNGGLHDNDQYVKRRILIVKEKLGPQYWRQPNETSNEYWTRLFGEFKADYYEKKMGCTNVTKEFLNTQAATYIRGLQWVLQYYYHGCCSWTWYYDGYYAPRASDIVDFGDVNLEFKLGKPFLPYEQLLAVLPPRSVNLIPKAYRSLINSPELSDYYPRGFKIDLNGKDQNWEAVVLLPLLNEKVLLKAMKPHTKNLTAKEKKNNKHGPLLFYNYKSENSDCVLGPRRCSCLRECHAFVTSVSRDYIVTKSSQFMYERRQLLPVNEHVSGFSTLKYKLFNLERMVGVARVFQTVSKGQNTIIRLINSDIDESLKEESEGNIVHVNWPNLQEARVHKVLHDGNLESGADAKLRTEVARITKGTFNFEVIRSFEKDYWIKKGVDIGEVEYVAFVNLLKGIRRTYDADGKFYPAKVWCKEFECCPIQTIVKNPTTIASDIMEPRELKELFPPGSTVFLLEPKRYGCKAVICADNYELIDDELPLDIEIDLDNDTPVTSFVRGGDEYYSATDIARKISVNQKIIGKVAGNIVIEIPAEESLTLKRFTVNIGLLLKFNRTNERLPGYSKIQNDFWRYSSDALILVQEYINKWPDVIEFLSRQPKDQPFYRKRDIFPGREGYLRIMKIFQWVRNLDSSKVDRVSCSSVIMDEQPVRLLETVIGDVGPACSIERDIVKIKYLFKSDLVVGNVDPDPEAEHRLLDRVICAVPHHAVPLGLRGFIISIIKSPKHEDTYDVLYDEPFPKGKILNCELNRVYRMPKSSIINISYGKRVWNARKDEFEALETASDEDASETSTSHTPDLPDPAPDSRPRIISIVMALWRICHPRYFRFMNIFKTVVDDGSENTSQTSETVESVSTERREETNVERYVERLNENRDEPQTKFYEELLNYFKSQQLPKPKCEFFKLEGKIICQFDTPDDHMYFSKPHDTESWAREDAAEQALNALQIHSDDEEQSEDGISTNAESMESTEDSFTGPESSGSATEPSSGNVQIPRIYPGLYSSHFRLPYITGTFPVQRISSQYLRNMSFMRYQNRNSTNGNLGSYVPVWIQFYVNWTLSDSIRRSYHSYAGNYFSLDSSAEQNQVSLLALLRFYIPFFPLRRQNALTVYGQDSQSWARRLVSVARALESQPEQPGDDNCELD